MRSHDQSVAEQFDPRAQAYLDSSVHADGKDLAWVRDWLAEGDHTRSRALDVGCGAGHLGFLLASRLGGVTLVDPSPSMLATAQQEAVRRGLSRVEGKVAKAERLPFPDHSFDLVASRFSAHHWSDVPAALKQMRRVLRGDGRLLMIDLLGDDSPLVDSHLQTLELLRDPSHVRDYTVPQWQTMIEEAGFTVSRRECWPLRIEFQSWVARMQTPPAAIDALRWVLATAPAEVHERLAIEADGSFTPAVGLFVAHAT